MDNVATRCKTYKMYKEMCGQADEIIKEIGEENSRKEKYYSKLISIIGEKDSNFLEEIKYIRRSKGREKQEEKDILINTERVEVRKANIGEIESLNIYYPLRDSEINLISKKEYTIGELYFTKYLIEQSEYRATNKYVVILVENGNRVSYLVDGVQITTIGRAELKEIAESVKRQEIVEKKIMPEFEKYLQIKESKQKKMGTEKNYYGFIQYLKHIYE